MQIVCFLLTTFRCMYIDRYIEDETTETNRWKAEEIGIDFSCVHRCSCGAGPKTVSESAVSNTKLGDFLALTELWGGNSLTVSLGFVLLKQTHRVFEELTGFAAELCEFSLPKQYSRNTLPPVSYSIRVSQVGGFWGVVTMQTLSAVNPTRQSSTELHGCLPRVANFFLCRGSLRAHVVSLRELHKTCAQGSPDRSQKICAKDVWGQPKMCRDCAKFVRGACTCSRRIFGGGFRECVGTNFAQFPRKFEFFHETKLHGQKKLNPRACQEFCNNHIIHDFSSKGLAARPKAWQVAATGTAI